MSYPRIYNAATDMVDRNVTHGPRRQAGVHRSGRDADLRRATGARQPHGQPARHLRDCARSCALRCCCSTRWTFRPRSGARSRPASCRCALNTLLTPEQYAYILGDSRAKALIVSAQLLPVVQPILGQLPFLKHIFVAGGEAPAFALPFRGELWHPVGRAPPPADTCSDETAFWLYSSGSTGMPKGVRHVHSSPMETARLHGPGLPRHARG